MPPSAAKALRELGANLALARLRRKESLKAWAQRLQVSVPTLMRMERGDAKVGVGVYATALWLIGRHGAMAELAAPKEDLGALELEIQTAAKRHARQKTKPESIHE